MSDHPLFNPQPVMAIFGEDGPEHIVPLSPSQQDAMRRSIAKAYNLPEVMIGQRPPWYRRWWQHWSRRP